MVVHEDAYGSVRRPGLTSEWFDNVTINKTSACKKLKHLKHKSIHEFIMLMQTVRS